MSELRRVLYPLSLGTVLDRTVQCQRTKGTVQCPRTRGRMATLLAGL